MTGCGWPAGSRTARYRILPYSIQLISSVLSSSIHLQCPGSRCSILNILNTEYMPNNTGFRLFCKKRSTIVLSISILYTYIEMHQISTASAWGMNGRGHEAIRRIGTKVRSRANTPLLPFFPNFTKYTAPLCGRLWHGIVQAATALAVKALQTS